MTRRPPGQSERSRMRRRVRTFATTMAKLLRENKRHNPTPWRYDHGWNEALAFAAKLLEQRGRGGA